MTVNLKDLEPNQPIYLYQQPMFSITVSAVLIAENGTFLLENNGIYRFPGGVVKAGQETIQFAAVRYIKEQVGITLQKEALMPVDFRSDPERSPEKNVADIGFVCMPNHVDIDSVCSKKNVKWEIINFEKNKLEKSVKFFMDHELLLNRAIDVIHFMK